MKAKLKNDEGQILITLIIVVPAIILIATAYQSLAVSNFNLARADQFHTQAQIAADAGADYAIQQINQDNSWAGTGQTNLQNDSLKKTTYQVAVTTNSSTSKTLTVTGRVFFPPAAA